MKKKTKKIAGGIATAFFVAVFLFVLGCIASVFIQIGKGATPSLFGFRFYYVLTDSMTPALMPGEVIISKAVTDSDVDLFVEGAVITYTATEGELKGNPITHRIVKGVYYDEVKEGYAVLTRGDKEGAPVDSPVLLKDINAVMVKKSVFLTWMLKAFRSGAGFALLLVLPLAFMLVCLVLRLIVTIKSPSTEERMSEEERVALLKKQAVEEYIKNQAIEEYLKKEKQKKDDE